MLIPTYYLLSKIWDIFATRRRILLKINKNYFRGGQMRRISKDITKHYQMACSSGELHAICFLWAHSDDSQRSDTKHQHWYQAYKNKP